MLLFRWFPIPTTTAALLFSSCTQHGPPAKTETGKDPHALGLREPTAAERARLEAMSQKNPPLPSNDLARERLNAERQTQGLPPLPSEPATTPPK